MHKFSNLKSKVFPHHKLLLNCFIPWAHQITYIPVLEFTMKTRFSVLSRTANAYITTSPSANTPKCPKFNFNSNGFRRPLIRSAILTSAPLLHTIPVSSLRWEVSRFVSSSGFWAQNHLVFAPPPHLASPELCQNWRFQCRGVGLISCFFWKIKK